MTEEHEEHGEHGEHMEHMEHLPGLDGSPAGKSRPTDDHLRAALHDSSTPWPMAWAEKLLLSLIAFLLIAAFSVLVLRTDPDPRGLGTHEQLGMKPCGWLKHKGYPCPTCGYTTAASLLVHLRPIDAFIAQPSGTLLALSAMAFVLLSLLHIYQGRSLFARLAFWPWFRILSAAVAILLASWYYLVQTWQP